MFWVLNQYHCMIRIFQIQSQKNTSYQILSNIIKYVVLIRFDKISFLEIHVFFCKPVGFHMIFSFKLLAQQLIFEVYPNMAPKKMMKSMKAGLGKPAKVKKQAKKPAKAKSAASASLGKD